MHIRSQPTWLGRCAWARNSAGQRIGPRRSKMQELCLLIHERLIANWWWYRGLKIALSTSCIFFVYSHLFHASELSSPCLLFSKNIKVAPFMQFSLPRHCSHHSSILLASNTRSPRVAMDIASDAAHKKNNPLKPFYILLIRKMNNEHKSNEIRDPEKMECFPKYFGLSAQEAQKYKNCSDKPVIRTTLFKRLLVFCFFHSPLWLLIYLFVDLFFSALGAEGRGCLMCSHGSLYQRGGRGRLPLHSG